MPARQRYRFQRCIDFKTLGGDLLRLLVVGAILVGMSSTAEAQDYVTPSIMAAKEALVRLGYDVGVVDGKWDPKARAAMNDLREKNGLPAAQGFVGSSLELVHRLSPGATAVPHPGILVTDPVLRREFIQSHPRDPQEAFCQGPAGADDELITDVIPEKPIAKVTASADEKLGYMTHDQDWFTPVMHAVMGAHNACIAGDNGYCGHIVELMSKWAGADAMKVGVKQSDFAYEDVSWGANIVLRKFIFAYADARRLIKVDPVTDAAILDWLKRRIDDYQFIKVDHNPPTHSAATRGDNHAMADAMPAMAFGAMVGDRSMMETGFSRYRISLGTMRDDGSLPSETRRGANALHYSNFQIGQLISTQVLAQAQGIDPTGDEAAAGKTVPKAVGFLLDAFEDFDKYTPYAKQEQGSSRPDYKLPWVIPAHFGWLPAYLSLFRQRREHHSATYDIQVRRARLLAGQPGRRKDAAASV